MTGSEFLAVLPLIILVGWACVLLLLDLFIEDKKRTASLAALGMGAAISATLFQADTQRTAFGGMIVQDNFAVFLTLLVLASGLVAILISYDYLKRMVIERGEYYTLLLFAIAGVVLMTLAADLIVVFLALELLSIPLYILAGFARPRAESEESALKYFLLGAFSSGFIVYGIALVYGATGSTGLTEILASFTSGATNQALLVPGAALILVGLGFKVGAVPFHMWTPDVYQGAPSAVTAFMAVGAKVGGFAALLRIFVTAFPKQFELVAEMTVVLWGVAAATMILGNLLAIAQKSIKRLLAYSSISHAGYILMAVVPYAAKGLAADTVGSALFYLLAFAVTSFGAWAVVMALEQSAEAGDGTRRGLLIDDYAGLARKNPALALAMTVFMLSFTGLPPTLGFAGKIYLFRTALEGGMVWLAVIGVLTSLVSAYYYLRVVIVMYMVDGEPVVHGDRSLRWTAIASAGATVLLSIFAAPLFAWAAQSGF